MVYDIEMLKQFYAEYPRRLKSVRNLSGRPLTLAVKILYTHLYQDPKNMISRGTDYADFRPNRVAMQDATAQMALLQFMNAGRKQTAVPATVHCDHLIHAFCGAKPDLIAANESNREVYDFLRSVADKYGLGFWEPGAGIIHQIVLENYAFPGGMMLGTDSHTPNAGGLGMIAIGAGGADAVDVMTGMPWELKMPKLIGVHLVGTLNGWAAPKDVILKLAGILTVKGATNAIIEYFGEGASTLPATGKATICNMGAEVGATTSLFPFDENTKRYLVATSRESVAEMASVVADDLKADEEVEQEPEKYFDRIIEINLSEMEPYINGPFTPDAATPISEFAAKVKEKGFPEEMEVGLIGSCTNSSYQDLSRAASVAKQALDKHIPIAAELIVNPGSEQINQTADRDGILDTFKKAGATIMANACGPCIGQWERKTDDPQRRNSIVSSFNRNFARRADGNPNTHAFVASPELAMALTIAGRLTFNPLIDVLKTSSGENVKLSEPSGSDLPANGFFSEKNGYIAPKFDEMEIRIDPNSARLQSLKPFAPWDGGELLNMPLLIKTEGKCTTDHISMAGKWLRFRGHLENISDNLLMGAVNAFNHQSNLILNQLTGHYDCVSSVAKAYKEKGLFSIVVAEDNYGEGSSREHAAMEPRFLFVRVILAKSFARIHETNLKKQGMLALTFHNTDDYNKIRENDHISVIGLRSFAPGKPMRVCLIHADNTMDSFLADHTYNEQQIIWFKAGSALNAMNLLNRKINE